MTAAVATRVRYDDVLDEDPSDAFIVSGLDALGIHVHVPDARLIEGSTTSSDRLNYFAARAPSLATLSGSDWVNSEATYLVRLLHSSVATMIGGLARVGDEAEPEMMISTVKLPRHVVARARITWRKSTARRLTPLITPGEEAE